MHSLTKCFHENLLRLHEKIQKMHTVVRVTGCEMFDVILRDCIEAKLVIRELVNLKNGMRKLVKVIVS